jgi:hypothetical protein
LQANSGGIGTRVLVAKDFWRKVEIQVLVYRQKEDAFY